MGKVLEKVLPLGTAIGSSLLGADAAKDSAKAQLAGIESSNKLIREMFDKQTALNEPFRTAGISGLQGLQQAAGAQVNPFSFDYSGYFNSPEYAALSQQAQQQTLAGQSATGGLRSGGANVALSAIAPQLAQQARGNAMNEYSLNRASEMDRYNRLMGLVGVGQGATQMLSSQAGQAGQSLANNAFNGGIVNANRIQGQNQAIQGGLSDLTTLFMRGF